MNYLKLENNRWQKLSLDHTALAKEKNLSIQFYKQKVSAGTLPLSKPEAIFFDMDSTAITTEGMDELAKVYGCGKAVEAITKKAMEGKIDFETSFHKRLKLLTGMSWDLVLETASKTTITPGFEKICSELNNKNIDIFLISGGFTPFVNHLTHKVEFKDTMAHSLNVKDGKLTGKHSKVIDGQGKVDWIKTQAKKYNFNLAHCAAVGDGSNDIPMLSLVGIPIGWHPKPKLYPYIEAGLFSVSMEIMLGWLKEI